MYAVWLLFEKQDQGYLEKIIKQLCKKYDAPFFIPHITAYGLVSASLEDLEKITQNSIENTKPFFVEKIKLDYSDDFWKTLFVELKQNDSLTKIHKNLKESLEKLSKYEFLPHASLLYKKLDTKEKKHLANTIQVKERYKVSKIAILDFSENIKEWKIIREYEL